MTVYAGETARIEVALQDEDGKPASPLPATVTVEVLDEDEAVLQAATGMNLVVEDKGALTAATATTLTDATQAWRVDQWRDACVRITSGNAIGAERRVKSNTATVLTLDTKQVVNEAPVGPLAVVPAAADLYELHRAKYRKNYDVPDAEADSTITAVIRAATPTGPNPYTSVEKLPIRVDGPAV